MYEMLFLLAKLCLALRLDKLKSMTILNMLVTKYTLYLLTFHTLLIFCGT